MGTQFRRLKEEIESCRDQMVRLASDSSLTNHQVIETSQKLDHLLNEFSHYKK